MLLLHYALRRPRLRRATEPGLREAGHETLETVPPEDSENDGPGGACTPVAVREDPADNGALCLELRVRKWWEVLVTLQSSLPACLMTPHLQGGSRITSRNGCGGGSCTHGDRAYGARLNLILPAVKWWNRWVTLPHRPACKAGALLVCHDPGNGRPPWCCPKRTGFWRPGGASWRAACEGNKRTGGISELKPSVCRALSNCSPALKSSVNAVGALLPSLAKEFEAEECGPGSRPRTGWCGCRESHPDILPGKETFCC